MVLDGCSKDAFYEILETGVSTFTFQVHQALNFRTLLFAEVNLKFSNFFSVDIKGKLTKIFLSRSSSLNFLPLIFLGLSKSFIE